MAEFWETEDYKEYSEGSDESEDTSAEQVAEKTDQELWAEKVNESLINNMGGATSFTIKPNSYISSPEFSPTVTSQKTIDNTMSTLEEERQKLKEKMAAKERELMGALVEKSTLAGKAVDQELQNLIGQSEYYTNLSKQAIASQQYAGGLGRTGMTVSRLGQAETAGETQRLGYEASAQEKKADIGSYVRGVGQQVANREQEIRQQLIDYEIQGLQDAAYKEEIQNMKMRFKTYITDLQTDAQTKMALYNILGSVASAGGIVAGYYYSQPDAITKGIQNSTGYGIEDSYQNVPNQNNYSTLV